MGRNDPNGALMESTSVFAIDSPTALTPWPNMMAPNPQANPVRMAAVMAPPGADLRMPTSPGTVTQTIRRGNRTHATSMKTAQTFSHDQRPKYLMGRAKAPHITPAKRAQATPNMSADAPMITRDLPCPLGSLGQYYRLTEVQFRCRLRVKKELRARMGAKNRSGAFLRYWALERSPHNVRFPFPGHGDD